MDKSVSTLLGRFHQKWFGVQSRKKINEDINDDSLGINKNDPDLIKQTKKVFVKIIDTNNPTDTIYTDIAGKFSIVSTRVHSYIFVMYIYNCNAIISESMRTCAEDDILTVFMTLLDNINTRGFQPDLLILDNEASQKFCKALEKYEIKYQLEPPGNHQTNNAERSIQTFKNHFITGLCSVDLDFPLQFWDRLIQHANIILHLLRRSQTHPQLSAYCHSFGEFGEFGYNVTPLAPPGTKVVFF